MARILILGAGISGHTVARYLGKWLGKSHAITVVSPKPNRQAGAVSIHPDGGAEHTAPYVTIEYTNPARHGQTEAIEYDYLPRRSLRIHL